ncbi:antibiotic biosynthesis monooxygenase [Bacillus sp. FJAT-47783]|uniref:antibiotic biosynthesis monooxygenase family protein n=1 Tax=Bacillus sp. FJAT-47783 TaxID=2922712 RepID=UPI001FABC57F|nr:antibiotic biosynthesis monooxygenase [Bacillus sp. FJAT-47783]
MMNFYITYGTIGYLQQLLSSHPNEPFILMQNKSGTILTHETTNASLFKEPKKYKVINSDGVIPAKATFAAFHYFSISDEGIPLFEHDTTAKIMKTNPPLSAFRVLRPVQNDAYIIVTFWENETLYQNWIALDPLQFIKKNYTKKKLFSPSSYTTTYYIVQKEDG